MSSGGMRVKSPPGGFFGGKSPGGPQPRGQRYPTGWMGGGMRGGLGDVGDDPGDPGGEGAAGNAPGTGGGVGANTGSSTGPGAPGGQGGADSPAPGLTATADEPVGPVGITPATATDPTTVAMSVFGTGADDSNDAPALGGGPTGPGGNPAAAGDPAASAPAAPATAGVSGSPPGTPSNADTNDPNDPTTFNLNVWGGRAIGPRAADFAKGLAPFGILGARPSGTLGNAARTAAAIAGMAVPGLGTAASSVVGGLTNMAQGDIAAHAEDMFGVPASMMTSDMLAAAAADIASTPGVVGPNGPAPGPGISANSGVGPGGQGGAGGINPFAEAPAGVSGGPVAPAAGPGGVTAAGPRSPILGEDVDARRRSGGMRLGGV